ncbi:hypothetical protein BDV93DRAFT_555945 [Ceratobasidium sp. AG-I]|nr:hypothetical protein BDV93DRAFT_555945 [Ceratobasidium sp. AG-I]
MSNSYHPIFSQFELDPSRCTIRNTPHPGWPLPQPQIPGTLTASDPPPALEDGFLPGSNVPWGMPPGAGPRPWRGPPEPSYAPMTGPYPTSPVDLNAMMALSRGHSEGLAGSGGRLPEPRSRQESRYGPTPGRGRSHRS